MMTGVFFSSFGWQQVKAIKTCFSRIQVEARSSLLTHLAAACGPIHHTSGGACICRWDNSCFSSTAAGLPRYSVPVTSQAAPTLSRTEYGTAGVRHTALVLTLHVPIPSMSLLGRHLRHYHRRLGQGAPGGIACICLTLGNAGPLELSLLQLDCVWQPRSATQNSFSLINRRLTTCNLCIFLMAKLGNA